MKTYNTYTVEELTQALNELSAMRMSLMDAGNVDCQHISAVVSVLDAEMYAIKSEMTEKEQQEENAPIIVSVMSLGYGKFLLQALINNELINKGRGDSPEECIEQARKEFGNIQVLSGNAWLTARKESRQRLEASLVRIDEKDSIVVDDVLWDKHPNLGEPHKVVVTRITKNLIFVRHDGSYDMEPMKYRRDGSLVGDEYKRCRLFRKVDA